LTLIQSLKGFWVEERWHIAIGDRERRVIENKGYLLMEMKSLPRDIHLQ
jgi:hypothetical protein